jgi:hypothetical protein
MSKVISSTAGTRTEPLDSYKFLRGTTATFKATFYNDGVPTKVNTSTSPVARILEPSFLNDSPSGPRILASITGTLVPGQEFEYMFEWDIPASLPPLNNYLIRYEAQIGAFNNTFGDEFFEVVPELGQISIKNAGYCTVTDVRKKKFNIDDYLPKMYAKDVNARNDLIQSFIDDATVKLREELSLFKQRGHSENYRLFCIYYTIWSILLAARGEDGSAVSDRNLNFWRQEWQRILAQEKREGVFQGLPLGRG